LQWRFDVNTFRLLGRELITDRVTAVFELVKNCYDANSTKVTVKFSDITSPDKSKRQIIISDDGMGMSFEDIRDKWMVVGTNSKRSKLYSGEPFNRKFVGEKGIGRFAVDKLGEKLLLTTKVKDETQWLNVTINWDEYEKEALDFSSNEMTLFTEINNDYYFTEAEYKECGTTLTISNVDEIWTDSDIERLYKELSKLVSPFYPLNPPFEIYIHCDEFKHYINRQVKADTIKFYSHFAEITYDSVRNQQQTLRFNETTGKIFTEWVDIKSFGPLEMKIYYFNESAKRKYNAFYKNDDTRIDGFRIYRDGLVATPFAEYESDVNKKRDILGIEKRRWRAAFDKVATREIIGIIDITKAGNHKIIDATNRQDFLDNAEYRLLKEFIIEQVDIFSEVKLFERIQKKTLVEKELQKAGNDVKNFEAEITKLAEKLSRENPKLINILEPLKQRASDLNTTISQSINEQRKYQKDVARKENIYLSLMSLQEYAANISHAVRTSLGKIKRMAEFFMANFPNPELNQYFLDYSTKIFDEMNTLIKVTDFMLSYARADIDSEDFNVREVLQDLFVNQYERTFSDEKIEVRLEIKDDFILHTNKRFFQDIFQNLISNSIKALRSCEIKLIKCSGFLDTDNFTIYFSDNGIGVDKGDEKWIFEIYNTRTAEYGGAGIGLFTVEKRIEALKGNIQLVENELKPRGATFKITIPFDRS
jgi:signal transduction histidine kinase